MWTPEPTHRNCRRPPGQFDSAVAEIFATLAAHTQLHADELDTNPQALLELVIERAKRGLPPDRR